MGVMSCLVGDLCSLNSLVYLFTSSFILLVDWLVIQLVFFSFFGGDGCVVCVCVCVCVCVPWLVD